MLRHVDGSNIKIHQHGLQGSKPGREHQAIGLTRGGMTTKLLAAADEDGLLCDFVLCAGNFHDLTAARLMLESFRGTHVVGDKGFNSLAFARNSWSTGPLAARSRAKVAGLLMSSLNPLTVETTPGAIWSKTSSSA